MLRIIPIEYADPEEVRKAIDTLFDGASRAAPARGARGRNPAARPGAGKVEVTALPQQRSLMISASDEDYAKILELVKSLEAYVKADEGNALEPGKEGYFYWRMALIADKKLTGKDKKYRDVAVRYYTKLIKDVPTDAHGYQAQLALKPPQGRRRAPRPFLNSSM